MIFAARGWSRRGSRRAPARSGARPGSARAGCRWLDGHGLLLRVIEDHVQGAAVVGDARNRLGHLVLGGQKQRGGVEVLRSGRRGLGDRVGRWGRCSGRLEACRSAGRSRPAEARPAGGCVADPAERHRGLLSATIAALRAIPGSALRMMSNWALIALTAGSSGRRCSVSTPSSAPASVARPAEMRARPRETTISATPGRQRRRRSRATVRTTRRGRHDPPNPSVRAFM